MISNPFAFVPAATSTCQSNPEDAATGLAAT